jgi:CRP/FNR family transcriptional regulator, cyclic AMP receptor protein
MLDINLLLATGATYRNCSRNEIIFNEGNSPFFYYQLVQGRIKLVNFNESGRECIQDFIEPGESFGEIALLEKTDYVVTAIVETDVLIIRLPKNDFNAMIMQYPGCCYDLMQILCRRLRFKTQLVKDLYNYSPTSRIKSFITYIKGQNKFICPATKKLMLTRQQIADMTGLRVETVIRTFKNLHRESIVRIDEKGKVYC